MKKFIISLIVIILIIFGIYYIYNSRTNSFNDAISVDKEKVSSIEIKNNDEKVVINNRDAINDFIDDLSNIKLKKINKSTQEFDESYWIRIFENGKEVYGLTFYDDDYVDSFDFSNKKTKNYRIVDDSNLDIKKFLN
ncbi:DUF5301 domain-containing protein [Priestia endophytica]